MWRRRRQREGKGNIIITIIMIIIIETRPRVRWRGPSVCVCACYLFVWLDPKHMVSLPWLLRGGRLLCQTVLSIDKPNGTCVTRTEKFELSDNYCRCNNIVFVIAVDQTNVRNPRAKTYYKHKRNDVTYFGHFVSCKKKKKANQFQWGFFFF